MATTIPSISLSNTFGQWLITTQSILSELNTIGSGDYKKNSNTFTIDSSGTGLAVTNTASFGTISVSKDSTLTGNVSIGQRLVVSGNNSSVSDIYLDRNVLTFSTSTPKTNTIISVNRGEHLLASDANAQIKWNETSKIWEMRDVASPTVYYKILNSQDGGVIFLQANNAYSQANAAYNQANGAIISFNRANAAYTQANASYSQANAAYDQSNTVATQISLAYNQANSAYTRANTANTNAANASFLSTGTVPTARLGSGTANATTYLAGDNSWKTVVSGATITNDTTTNFSYNVGLANGSSGSWTSAYVSSSKLYFNPSTGTLYSTIFSSLSDQELKENVVSLINTTEVVKEMNPVEFTWKDSHKKSYGLIAQEIEKVLPDIVTMSGDGIKAVEYQSLIAFLIGAIKELSERVENLENK